MFSRKALTAAARRRLLPARITSTPQEIRDRHRYGDPAPVPTADPARARLAAATRKALRR